MVVPSLQVMLCNSNVQHDLVPGVHPSIHPSRVRTPLLSILQRLRDRTVFVVGVAFVAAVADVLKRNVFAQRRRDTFDKEAFSESQLARAQTPPPPQCRLRSLFCFFPPPPPLRFRILFMLISLAHSLRGVQAYANLIKSPVRSALSHSPPSYRI